MGHVYIIGTSHPYQLISSNSATASAIAYQHLLEEACVKRGIRAIAEEMSREGLKGGSSLAEDVSQKLGLLYSACDPDSATREQLGILNEGLLKFRALQDNWDKETLNQAILCEYRKREEYWLRELQKLDTWPVLFICGTDHVASFGQLLSKINVEAMVLARDWKP